MVNCQCFLSHNMQNVSSSCLGFHIFLSVSPATLAAFGLGMMLLELLDLKLKKNIFKMQGAEHEPLNQGHSCSPSSVSSNVCRVLGRWG